ncbi:ROK family transcriptional regulator [Catenulispora pinisilvae]|uniref:ROK family transcriptional regulator n=1 Tax=Catenulispora pinisilvae TaxID=2705253 RepID=UPI001E53CEF4|nr:ROK family transcriptional regulator [Catenulispora pinisilvae]
MRDLNLPPRLPPASGRPAGSARIDAVDTPADSSDVRRRNLALVLRHIAAHGPCARTELAAATGLVSASITALAAELIGSGLVREAGLASSGSRGRPRKLLELRAGRVQTVAVEVMPDRLAGAVCDLSGTVTWRGERVLAAPGDPRPVAEQIAGLVQEALEATATPGRTQVHTARLVLAVPGAVIEDDLIADSILLGWRRIDLAALVRAALPAGSCPVSVVNEANMAAFAEYHALASRTGTAPRAFAYLRVGPGIGGGLVVDGQIQTGGHGMAGEFGHIPVAFDGPACKCGDHGCLVTYLGLEALMRAAGLDPDLHDQDPERARADFDRRLRAGDPGPARALEAGARALATALTAVSRVADPEQVVLGGHLAAWSDWLVPTVLRHFAGRRAITPTDEPVLSTELLGRHATIVGALRHGCETVFNDPASVPSLTRP